MIRRLSRPLALAAFVAAAPLLAAQSALADDVNYVNERFGTSATFPGERFPQPLPAPTNGDGLGWTAPNGAEVYIYGRNNLGGETPQTIIADRAETDEVTYKASGKRWAVVSGYRDGKIFYERYILRGDLIHSVAVRYPEEVRDIYDPLVGPVTLSLRGPSSS